MAEKKIIAVVGATGAQGGGLCRAVLGDADSGYAVRALTRKPESAKARELEKLGAEVVKADLDDAQSLENAFHGAHAAYCVTNFWEHLSPEKELAQAKNMAEAASRAGVAHVIWSTLEDTRKLVPEGDDRIPTLMGKYKVPHFDAKGEADHFFSDLELPVTFLVTSFYWENLIHFGMGPKKRPDGLYEIVFPMGKAGLAAIACEDIGRCACNIFRNPDMYLGKRIGIAGSHITGEHIAGWLTRALGRRILYRDIPPEEYRALGFPGAEDLGNMFQVYRDYEKEILEARDLDAARRLHPAMLSFEGWLSENRDRIPFEEPEHRKASGE